MGAEGRLGPLAFGPGVDMKAEHVSWSSKGYAATARATGGIKTMHIETLRIRNFRHLKDVEIDLASDISIFVGANNSGKTSASHALQLFVAASRERFSVHDFSAESWAAIDAFGDGVDSAVLPTISLDIGRPACRVRRDRCCDAARELPRSARAGARFYPPRSECGADYHPSPRTLRDYLADNLRREGARPPLGDAHHAIKASFAQDRYNEPLRQRCGVIIT